MKILNIKETAESQIIKHAVEALRSGGLLVYPTETVYGLGADATNQEAVNKLLNFKGKRDRKPILIAVSDQQMAEEYVELNETAKNLYKQFLPGPVAVISRLKRTDLIKQGRSLRSSLANGIASLDDTVGIRIPDYPLIKKIIKTFGRPVTTTSANISNARHPWSISDIKETTPAERLSLVDTALDAGALPKREPSTIIDTSKEKTEIIREGSMPIQLLENQSARLNKQEVVISKNETKTIEIAKNLLQKTIHDSRFLLDDSTTIFALQGQLGAGKTVFTKGIAEALNITEPIRSPSYTLVREYPIPSDASAASVASATRATLFHIDAWRLSSPEEFSDLGLNRMLCPGNVIVIEWVDRLSSLLKDLNKKAKIIFIEISVIAKNQREIKIQSEI